MLLRRNIINMRINGGRIGARNSATGRTASGVWSLTDQQQQISPSFDWPKRIVTNGLIVHLDASDPASYPGSGTVWYDLSGNGNNFNILASAWFSSGVRSYMNFCGANGCAKNGADIALSGDVTYLVATRILNSSADWRTLTRGYSGDHHVIVQSGGWGIGMYDNDGGAFINTNYSQESLPGYSTNAFNIMCWRWTNADNPTYDFNVNNVQRGTITNANARYTRGFGSLGNYHAGSTDVSVGNQWWGDIAVFAAYNRRLSDTEVAENFNALRGRFEL